MADTDVLIVGAGPTGLVLALWLSKLGIRVRIIDTTTEPGTTSRALAVHARTLELYRQLDLADAVVEAGHTVPAVNLWVRGRKEAEVSFEDVGADLTPYPFLHIFPQDEHERFLIDRLQAMGVTVERRTELVGYVDDGRRVTARLRGPSGVEESCGSSYIAGCDGARSQVRHVMGVEFPGGTYQQLFYVADVEASGPAIDGKLHIDLDDADFLAVFPLAGGGRARLIGTVRDERAAQLGTLRFDDVQDRAIEQLALKVGTVNWFSTYRVHHRVTDHFRKGRAFLLGDAAHIHSPVGGQGMNTGIGDAVNLAWKLEAVIRGRAPDRLLDSYETERIAFARRLVKTTDRAFTLVVSDGKLAELIRTRVVPIALPAATRIEAFRSWMFRTVSQIMINYRDSPVSHGKAGEIHGGDRLPWVAAAGGDNYRPLAEITWQVHVYGEADSDLAAWCEAHHLPLHVFAWQPQHDAAGLARDALYLLRPDTYVALAERTGSAETLERYFADRDIGL